MTFDATITLGSILTLVCCVLTVIGGMWQFNRRVDHLEWRTNLMWRWFERKYGPNGERVERDQR